jgi:hypothetical protein
VRVLPLLLLLVPPIAVCSLLAGLGVIPWSAAFWMAGAVDVLVILLFEVGPSEGPLVRRRRVVPRRRGSAPPPVADRAHDLPAGPTR